MDILPVVGFLLCAAALWWMFGRGASSGTIDLAMQAIDNGALIVDVRTPGEFSSGHAKGAVNIPVDQLGVRIAELGEPGTVIVYCASGMRSRRASSILGSAGFDVVDVGRVSAFPADRIER